MPTVDELRARVTAQGPFFRVPAGTPDADCSRCDADGLFWIVTPNGRRMLVDCAAPHCTPPSTRDAPFDGRGVSHFATCPEATKFRTSRGKGAR